MILSQFFPSSVELRSEGEPCWRAVNHTCEPSLIIKYELVTTILIIEQQLYEIDGIIND